MMWIWKWYNSLSSRIKTSVTVSAAVVGLISTVMSIAGVSLHDWTQNIWISLLIIVGAFVLLTIAVYQIIGQIFKDSVSLAIRQTSVSIGWETFSIQKDGGLSDAIRISILE